MKVMRTKTNTRSAKKRKVNSLEKDYSRIGFVFQGGSASTSDLKSPQLIPLFSQTYDLTASTLKWE